MNTLYLTPLLSIVTACVPLPETDSPVADGDVYMWISADKDSYVSCGNPMQGCPEQNQTFGTSSQLVAAESEVGIRKSYVHFTPPTLPAGAVVLEAYVELFHSGKNEDGQTDELLLPVDLAAAPWSPQTLSYANQPNRELTGSITQLDLESQAWSSTPDIAGLAEQWIEDPAANNGVVVYWFSTSQNAEKGFFSNNHPSRTATDQGLAPRLLIKVAFAEGTSTAEMTLGTLPPDNDLDFAGEVLMVQFVSTTDWPASWDVAHPH